MDVLEDLIHLGDTDENGDGLVVIVCNPDNFFIENRLEPLNNGFTLLH